jgi:putative ABC transport system permease protein
MKLIQKIVPHGLRETAILSLKSIWRNKTRSTLTMLGIIIGVSAVILLVSLGQGLQNYITGTFEDLGTNLVIVLPGKVDMSGGFSSGSSPNFMGSKLDIEQAKELEQLGGPIGAAGAAIEVPAGIRYRGKSKYTSVAGITANYGKIRNIQVDVGREIQNSDVDLSRNVAILGKGIAENLFGLTNPIGQEITVGEDRYQVIGLLAKLGSGGIGFDVDNFVAIPITSAQRLTGNSAVQTIVVQAKTKEQIPDAITLTKQYLSKQMSSDDFSVIDQSNLLTSINQILGVLTTALGGIAAISLVVGGVGIMNIMLVSVTERTREIGLRKAVGAKPGDILSQFLIEAVILSVLGGMIGIFIGWGGAQIINRFFPASVSIWSVTLAFGVSALVGIVFGVAPAYRASKLDPIQALRYE